MKNTTVKCDRCGDAIKPGTPAAVGAREVALNTMTDEWEIAGGQETVADFCARCVARLRGWAKEPKEPPKSKPKRGSRRHT